MDYIKCLKKSDLHDLLDITYALRVIRDFDQFRFCLKRVKQLIFFDAALGIYMDKEALDKNEMPVYSYCAHDFSEDFLLHYVKDRYYEHSPVFQTAYKTWKLQLWSTAWSRTKSKRFDSMQLAQAYGYMDGWAHAVHHQNTKTLSFFAFCADKIENNKRSSAILQYLTPHFAESLQCISHASLQKNKSLDQLKVTPRQIEILNWLAAGKTTWDISVILSRSERVVKWHVNNLMQKFCAINRTHAVAIAQRKGLIEP